MPNTPALVQAAASVLAPGQSVTEDDTDLVIELLQCIGIAEPGSEKLLDAVTGLSGSGPAYVSTIKSWVKSHQYLTSNQYPCSQKQPYGEASKMFPIQFLIYRSAYRSFWFIGSFKQEVLFTPVLEFRLPITLFYLLAKVYKFLYVINVWNTSNLTLQLLS